MNKVSILFLSMLALLFCSSCGNQLIQLEATNARTGQVKLNVPEQFVLRQIGHKLIKEPLLPRMGSQSYTFRPGKKRLVLLYRDVFENENVGLKTYESSAFDINIEFKKGEIWTLQGPTPEQYQNAEKTYNSNKAELFLINSKGEKKMLKSILD